MRFVPFVMLAIVVGACKQEPTIVIKFEPNDLSGPAGLAGKSTAAPATDGGGGGVVHAAPPAKPADAECKTAADCAAVDEDCCNCSSGGKRVVMAVQKALAHSTALAKRCKGTVCTAMMSNDPSCTKVADCVEGKCALVEPKAPGKAPAGATKKAPAKKK
jgi:hypothetical protein